ncbi:MAG: hypothetical protein JWO40_648 [Candidatus Doudnabacteria bacterium]|nr:hypothetical protein [Candidatus Doudnabacteria bacterium]
MKKIIAPILIFFFVVLGFALFSIYRTSDFLAQNPVPFEKASNPSINKPPAPPEATLVAVGDIMLARNVGVKIKENGVDYPFEKVKPYLQADIVFANLECPITAGPPVPTGSMIFHANPGDELGLQHAGFNIVSLANNHTMNFGNKGMLDTVSLLKMAGINYVGAGKDSAEASAPVYIEKNGIKFAFLGYNDPDVVPDNYFATVNKPGTNRLDIPKMQTAVKAAKQNADIVIVSLHSGIEYKTPDQHQIDFDHAAIDAGAEMVLGHHPHVLQTVEKYHGKYILYSLGNFVFDQMFSLETRQSVITKTTFNKEGLEKIEFTPVMIYDYSQPQIVTDSKDQAAILAKLGVSETMYK